MKMTGKSLFNTENRLTHETAEELKGLRKGMGESLIKLCLFAHKIRTAHLSENGKKYDTDFREWWTDEKLEASAAACRHRGCGPPRSWCCRRQSTSARRRRMRMPERGRRRRLPSSPPDSRPRSRRPSAVGPSQRSGSCAPPRR